MIKLRYFDIDFDFDVVHMLPGNSSDIISHMSESESDHSPAYQKPTSAILRQLPAVHSPTDLGLIAPAPPALIKPPVQKRGAVAARCVYCMVVLHFSQDVAMCDLGMQRNQPFKLIHVFANRLYTISI